MAYSLANRATGELHTFATRAAARSFAREHRGQYKSPEYAQRVGPKLALGIPLSVARGHPKPGQTPLSRRTEPTRPRPRADVRVVTQRERPSSNPSGLDLTVRSYYHTDGSPLDDWDKLLEIVRDTQGPVINLAVTGKYPLSSSPGRLRDALRRRSPGLADRQNPIDPRTTTFTVRMFKSQLLRQMEHARDDGLSVQAAFNAQRIGPWPVRDVTRADASQGIGGQ